LLHPKKMPQIPNKKIHSFALILVAQNTIVESNNIVKNVHTPSLLHPQEEFIKFRRKIHAFTFLLVVIPLVCYIQ
jgi:hypothetical protein